VSAFDGDSPRQLVPRWRPWRTTARLGESASSTRRRHEATVFDNERALSRFRDRPNVGRAAELLTTALVHDYRNEEIQAIAGDYLSDRRPLLRELAAVTRMDPDERVHQAARVEHRDPRKRIAQLKVLLTREPSNALRWSDLAREYTVLAQSAKATSAIRVALLLAPENRFVLRSAATLYVQIDEKDRAVRLLETAPNLTVDPWVLAPYVAISDLADHKSHHHRDAVRLLQDEDIGQRDLAELAAALGTAEVNAGSGRRGRQLLRRSAEDPTENSLAQVEWMSARLRSRLVDTTLSDVLRDFEARARRAAYDGRWDVAVTSSSQWLDDQPFSADAACFGSFCAWMAKDWAKSNRIANDGLRSNPGHPVLLNNAAVALVEAGELAKAGEILSHSRGVRAQSRERAFLAATEGMFFFRIGMVEAGRHRYNRIITFFEDNHEDEIAARAALILAREEILANTPEAHSSLRRAKARMSASPPADLVTLRDRIASLCPQAGIRPVVIPKGIELSLDALLKLPATL